MAGFVAGIVLRRFREPDRLAVQLTGVANGFFVPAFFVLLGAGLDLRSLASDPAALALTIAMAAGSILVHVVGAIAGVRLGRLATGLLASAQLGLPAAAAALRLEAHRLSPAIAAALVAGGCLTLIPALVGAALLARGSGRPGSPEPFRGPPAAPNRGDGRSPVDGTPADPTVSGE